MILQLLQQAPPKITWVKVEKPTFDLVGVVLSSLGLAGLCALLGLALGAIWGVATVLRRRHKAPLSLSDHSLHLLDARRP